MGHPLLPTRRRARRVAPILVLGPALMLGCQSPRDLPLLGEPDEQASAEFQAADDEWGASESLADPGAWDDSGAPPRTSFDDAEPTFATVRVARGDTAWSIARAHGTNVHELSRLNALDDATRLAIGTRLRVPSSHGAARGLPDVSAGPPSRSDVPEPPAVIAEPEPAPAPVLAADTPDAEAPVRHRIAKDETLWRIARRYGVDLAELARHNGIADPTAVRAGTWLDIPSGGVGEDATPPPVSAPPRAEIPASPVPKATEDPPPTAYHTATGQVSVTDSDAADPYAAIDELLDLGDRYLDEARFKESIDLAELALQLLSELWTREDADSRIARAELTRGIALVALEQPAAGHHSFRRALRVEPDIVLGTDASPKIVAVFESARTEVKAARAGAVEAP